jgi:hypothetical protein
MTHSLSSRGVTELLTKEGWTVQQHPESEQVSILLKLENIEFPTFFRIVSEGPVIQTVTFLPVSCDSETVADVSRLLHLINKEIDFPGFGLDETTSTIIYRTAFLYLDGDLDERILQLSLRGISTACTNFTPVISSLTEGRITLTHILEEDDEPEE